MRYNIFIVVVCLSIFSSCLTKSNNESNNDDNGIENERTFNLGDSFVISLYNKSKYYAYLMYFDELCTETNFSSRNLDKVRYLAQYDVTLLTKEERIVMDSGETYYDLCLSFDIDSISCLSCYCDSSEVNQCTLAPVFTYTMNGTLHDFRNGLTISRTAEKSRLKRINTDINSTEMSRKIMDYWYYLNPWFKKELLKHGFKKN